MSSVNDFWMSVCEAISKHYVCLYLSTGSKAERKVRREWFQTKRVILRRSSDHDHCYLCAVLFNGVEFLVGKSLPKSTSESSWKVKLKDVYFGAKNLKPI